ncbi:MAG: hypothetical protein ACLR0U_10075 [Enterocloster clostridioformis]
MIWSPHEAGAGSAVVVFRDSSRVASASAVFEAMECESISFSFLPCSSRRSES